MKIYFHIGTEKTASSHLQSVAAINRELLRKEGIWFPKAGKREHQLLGGEISAGNAQDITDALNAEDFEGFSEIIKEHIRKAKEVRCHSLFLSNELLMLALAKENILEQFESDLKRNGCSDAEYLLFIRDPVSQALSLYKHRAKSGLVYEIEEWPQKQYFYGTGILSFLKEAEEERINLTCRKFQRKNGSLEGILFQEWLGLNVKLKQPPKFVNPSLSLSELLLLKKVRSRHPQLANILYDRLRTVSTGLKAKHTGIDQYHRDVLSNYLFQYKETWNLCNSHLPESEKIICPSNVNKRDLKQKKISSFSDAQMDEISGIIADSLSFRFKLQVEWLKWRKRLVFVKKKLSNKWQGAGTKS